MSEKYEMTTPNTIYLIPGEDVDGAPCMVWCDSPAPSYACGPAEAVDYVRKDAIRERLFSGWSGCSDHNCIVTGRKSGMGTNGGCRCLQSASRSQLNILQSRLQALMGSKAVDHDG